MMNSVRQYYRDILAELADSDAAQMILRELYGDPSLKYIKYNKEPISNYIRHSNYALA